MGMTPDKFWWFTPREFWLKMKGYFDRETFREQQAWERTRWQTCILLNIQIDKNSRITPRELVEFEWEKEEKRETVVEPLTQDELKRIKALYDHGDQSGS